MVISNQPSGASSRGQLSLQRNFSTVGYSVYVMSRARRQTFVFAVKLFDAWSVLVVLLLDQLAIVLVMLAAAWSVLSKPGALTWGLITLRSHRSSDSQKYCRPARGECRVGPICPCLVYAHYKRCRTSFFLQTQGIAGASIGTTNGTANYCILLEIPGGLVSNVNRISDLS
jgi:hypothetical protein